MLSWRQIPPKTLAIYEVLAMFMGLGALAAICLFWLLPALLLMGLPSKWRVPLARRMIAHCFKFYLGFLRLFCAVKLDRESINGLKDAGAAIIVANHPSLLDAVILLSCLPQGVCVMKAALQGNLLFGPAARLASYIVNDNPLEMVKQACTELESGAQVLLFPEGTRTRVFPVGEFGGTAALIAKRSGAPVQTVFIEFSTPYLGKAWSLFRRPPLPLRCTVTLGRQFFAKEQTTELTEQLQVYYQQHFMKGG